MPEFNAPIKPKKSSTASEVPQAGDLEVAEIAINTADGLMWTKHTDNSIVQIGGGGGGGAVDSVAGKTGVVTLQVTDNTDVSYQLQGILLDFDGGDASTTYTESTGKITGLTAFNSLPQSSTQVKYGASSVKFQKNLTQYLQSDDLIGTSAESVLAVGTGDFTLEVWVFLQTGVTTSFQNIFVVQSDSGADDLFNLTIRKTGSGASTDSFIFNIGTGSGAATTVVNLQSQTYFTYDTWHHLAVSRASGTLRSYVDGVEINSVANSTNVAAPATLRVNVGRDIPGTGEYADCYLDNLYFVDSAKYTTAFTPGQATALPVSPTNGQVLTWNSTESQWQPGNAGSATLDGLTDTTITSPTNGQVLKYNGSAWINDTDNSGGGAINDLTDVTITSATTGQVLKYDGAAWINDTDNAGAATTYSAGSLTDTYGGAVDSDVYYDDTTFLVKGEGANGNQTLTNVVNSSFSNSPVGTIENSTDYAFKGNGSIKVNNGRCAFPNNASFDLADSDFTIEWFVYNFGFGISGTVFFNADDQVTGTQYGWQVRLSTGVPPGVLYFDWSDDGVGTGASTYKTTWDLNESASIGVWQHFAIVRQGSLLTAYQNGTPLTLASGTDVINDTIWTSTSNLKLFKAINNGSDGSLCYAYYDNLRITKRARYYQQFKPIDYDFAVLQQPQAPRINEVLKWNDLRSQWEPSPEQGVAGLGRSTAVPAITSTDIVSNDSTPSSMSVSLTANSGELIVLVVMHRDNGIPTSGGFTRYQDRSFANINFSLGSNDQRLSILTKTATASEPGSYTVTSAGSFGGVVGAVVKNTSGIASVIESRGNGDTAIIDTDASTLNLTVAHWIYSNATSETYSQSGTALTQITDSPVANARMSGGYTNNATTVLSTHSTTTLTWEDDPNHQMVNIQFKGPVNISPCPIYADNTAASGGGLTFGDVYRTATGELRIVY